MATTTPNTTERAAQLRVIIRKHKRWDVIFGLVGIAAMSLGLSLIHI